MPLRTASLDELIERLAELSRAEPHLGVSPGAPSGDDPALSLEQERYQLGVKVLDMDHAPLSQEYLKRGCPHSLRGCVWAQVVSHWLFKSVFLLVGLGTGLHDHREGSDVLQ